MACPPTCGAAAALFVRPAFARRHGLRSDVRIAAQAMTTDRASTFKGGSMMKLVGSEMAREAADAGYDAAGVDPSDIRVCELHDCFAQNEPISYEALRLCGDGEAAKFVDDGDNTYGGRVVTNPSSGLLSKGPPARCNRPGAVFRANAPVAWHHRRAAGGRCQLRAAAQPGPGRGLRGDAGRTCLSPARRTDGRHARQVEGGAPCAAQPGGFYGG